MLWVITIVLLALSNQILSDSIPYQPGPPHYAPGPAYSRPSHKVMRHNDDDLILLPGFDTRENVFEYVLDERGNAVPFTPRSSGIQPKQRFAGANNLVLGTTPNDVVPVPSSDASILPGKPNVMNRFGEAGAPHVVPPVYTYPYVYPGVVPLAPQPQPQFDVRATVPEGIVAPAATQPLTPGVNPAEHANNTVAQLPPGNHTTHGNATTTGTNTIAAPTGHETAVAVPAGQNITGVHAEDGHNVTSGTTNGTGTATEGPTVVESSALRSKVGMMGIVGILMAVVFL